MRTPDQKQRGNKMNEQLKSNIKIEAIVSAAFNFFITGMIAALIHHKADTVATDLSAATDLLLTCLSTGILTALFSKASVKRAKTAGVIPAASGIMRFFSRLFRHPVLFGLLVGAAAAVGFAIPTILIFMLPGIMSIPFGLYVPLKCLFGALLGGGFTALEIYAGMCKADKNIE